MVAAVTELTSHKLAVNNALLTVLGTVLGLVVGTTVSNTTLPLIIFMLYIDQFPDVICL